MDQDKWTWSIWLACSSLAAGSHFGIAFEAQRPHFDTILRPRARCLSDFWSPEPALRDYGHKSCKKSGKLCKNCAFGSTLGLWRTCSGGLAPSWGRLEGTNAHNVAYIFQVSILEGVAGHILCESESEWHAINLVWTAQAWADRIWAVFRKSHPGMHYGQILTSFWVPEGATWVTLWARRGKSEGPGQLSLAGRFGLVVRVMGTVKPWARTKSRQRSKSV